MQASIPVYDIGSINKREGLQHLLIERFGPYLQKHYSELHRPHRHSFYHLVFFTKGRGYHTIDFQKFTVTPGQVYFMVPGQVHSWHFEGATDGYIVHFDGQFFQGFLYDSRYLERFTFFSGVSDEGVCRLPAGIQEPVGACFEKMLTETQDPDMIRLLLLQLFITVQRSCFAGQPKRLPQQKQLLLRNFQQAIEKHYRTVRLPKEYAELLYVTPNHLNALCQDLLGKTAGELIRDRVLLEAKRLLTNANTSVTEIAYELHFTDNSYFNRFFKKYAGCTPDEFRKSFNQ